ncbi:MAG TPA: VOC family protein [Alphaproteobacteria bacterium]|jgi:catechol 2,3-dioxygenase-like lactoylglutathione lyase family enzyme|nr:VOC family protein [Alphaproteobacteria bacterium]
MLTRMDHVALHVDDVASALRFYVEVLGFDKVYDSPGTGGQAIAYVQLGNASMIELTTRPGGEPMSGYHLGLECDDLTATCKRLSDAGLELMIAPKPTTPRGEHQKGWKRAVFKGPHGEMIEIKGP